MMKKYLIFISLVLFNLVEAQTLPSCFSRKIIDYKTTQYSAYPEYNENQFQLAKTKGTEGVEKTIFTIPVVFHVVYKTAAQNIPDSVILNQIEVLNQDFSRQNADTSNLRSVFNSLVGASNIRFELAQLDPYGNLTTGITRTSTLVNSFGSNLLFQNDPSDLEKAKSTAMGGHDPWDPTKYLNIWVCNMTLSGQIALLGYSTPPEGLPNWEYDASGASLGVIDGIMIQYQFIGSNNPNPAVVGGNTLTVKGRTVTHEVGHYLGLRHIWGDGDCNYVDGIYDTPNANSQSNFNCDATRNTCVDDINDLGDLPDMIENYMDYSSESCQNSFTKGQISLMHGVLNYQRYDLVHSQVATIEEADKLQIEVYPNPVRSENELTIKMEEDEKYEVSVFSEVGTLMYDNQFITNSTYKIPVKFKPGVYFIHVKNSKKQIVKKITVL